MRQFACKVRLSGSLYNEVPKSDVTVPEIIILRVIHGGEAVAEIVEVEGVKRSDAEERDRLAHIYGGAIKNRAEIIGGLPALIGFSGTALPIDAPGVPAASAKAAKKPGKGKPAEEPVDPPADEVDPPEDDENPEE
jgi:hypothetical protein